jgi:hypothetical protein
MKSRFEMTYLNALAFLYDHLTDCPVWIRYLTPQQLKNIARIMVAWTTVLDERAEIVSMQEIEKREIFRAVRLCGGDVPKAAEALKIGRTTIYRKLKQFGYSYENRILTHQASALADIPQAASHDLPIRHDLTPTTSSFRTGNPADSGAIR